MNNLHDYLKYVGYEVVSATNDSKTDHLVTIYGKDKNEVVVKEDPVTGTVTTETASKLLFENTCWEKKK